MKCTISIAVAAALAGVTPGAWAFDSGSTGGGAFNATVNTEVQLPPSGVLNFTTFTIASGVTVTFKKNATNTPVVILASGDVNIAGTLSMSGTGGTSTGTAGDGQLGDDGQPGVGGPGGFDGGRGGQANGTARGGNGLGPGGGGGALGTGLPNNQLTGYAGAGGGFNGAGGAGTDGGNAGTSYGSDTLLPLVGGSGGGGGRAGVFAGGGGGGGGGAILIASSGTVNVTGAIRANGGSGAGTGGSPYGCGGPGGGGSGGAIRILATRVAGNGTIEANGAGYQTTCWQGSGSGAPGRIRIEAEIMSRTAGTSPTFSFSSTPGPVFVAGLPTLRIARVGGFDVPEIPLGEVDVTLPVDFPNPVTIEFATTGVPVGNTVALKVVPAQGNPVNAISGALAGTSDSATASVQVSISGGPSVLQASTTYNIVVAQGEALSRYAQGERVEKVRLEAALGSVPMVTLITVSGREFTLPATSVPGFGG